MKHSSRGSTLEMALKLMKVFTLDKPEVSVADLYNRLNIGKSTAYRLVKTLSKEGILVKDAVSHLYRLSFTVLSFGKVVASQFETNNKEISDILQELVDKTGETGYIGTLHGTKVVYIQKIDSKHPIRLLSYLGKRNPAYCTSSGRSVLAYQSKKIVESVTKHGFYPFTKKTIKTSDELHHLLEKVRIKGYDVSIDEFHKGVSSIGAPILESRGQVRYSVNIVGPNQRITQDRISKMIKHVLDASEKIAMTMKQEDNARVNAVSDKSEIPISSLPPKSDMEQTELNTVTNAFRILRLFTVEQPEWGVREISRWLKINKTTIHRLISILSQEGFLEKNLDTNRYRLGIQFLTLSGIITTHAEIHREALPVLQWLVTELGETALIGVLEKRNVNYLHKVECRNPIQLRSSVGGTHPVHCTGSGKVMLAYESSKIIDQFVNKGLPRYTDKTITDPEEFKQHLKEGRRKGYAVSIDEIYQGIVSIGLPIFDYSDKVVASLTIVGSKERITQDKIPHFIEKAQIARGIISEKLGYYKEIR